MASTMMRRGSISEGAEAEAEDALRSELNGLKAKVTFGLLGLKGDNFADAVSALPAESQRGVAAVDAAHMDERTRSLLTHHSLSSLYRGLFHETLPAGEAEVRAMQQDCLDLSVRLEILLEERRVRHRLAGFTRSDWDDIKARGDENVQCPICLDVLPLTTDHSDQDDALPMMCCGKWVCEKCGLDMGGRSFKYITGQEVAGWTFDECPCCRTPNPRTPSGYMELIKDRAAMGKPYAQALLGISYMQGDFTEKDEQKGFHLLSLAATQGYCMAEQELGKCYLTGSGVEVSEDKALQYFERAALKGDRKAQFLLAAHYLQQPDKVDEGLRIMTLSAGNGYHGAEVFLGQSYYKGQYGLEVSYERSVYWLTKAAEKDKEFAQCLLPHALIQLTQAQFENAAIAGHSPLPEAWFWAKRAGFSKAQSAIRHVEGIIDEYGDSALDKFEFLRGLCVIKSAVVNEEDSDLDGKSVDILRTPNLFSEKCMIEGDIDDRKVNRMMLPSELVFSRGTPISFQGLVSKQHLNGKIGLVESFDKEKKRYAVRFEEEAKGGKRKDGDRAGTSRALFKPENLVILFAELALIDNVANFEPVSMNSPGPNGHPPPMACWNFVRRGETEDDNPKHEVMVVNAAGQQMGAMTTKALEPTACEILKKMLFMATKTGKRPFVIGVDCAGTAERLQFLLQDIRDIRVVRVQVTRELRG